MIFNSVISSEFRKIRKLYNGNIALIFLLNGLFIIAGLVNFTSCCSYSFTGAAVPEHLKTISIPVADDRSERRRRYLRRPRYHVPRGRGRSAGAEPERHGRDGEHTPGRHSPGTISPGTISPD